MNIKQQLFTHDDRDRHEEKTAVSLQQQLNLIGHIQSATFGAALTFLLFTLRNQTLTGHEVFVLWLFLLVAPPAISATLLISPVWRLLPLARRINAIVGGFGVSWLAVLIFYIAMPGSVLLSFLYLLFMAGYMAVIIGLWFFLQRRATVADEPLFP
jgi:hypothetical protein